MSIQLDQALNAYINIRDEMEVKEKAAKKAKAGYKDKLVAIETFLMGECQKMGTESIKAGGITAFQKMKDSVTIEDKEEFRETLAREMTLHLADLGLIEMESSALFTEALSSASAFDLLTLSANKVNCKAFMNDKAGIMPLGVKYFKENVIQVRRGSK